MSDRDPASDLLAEFLANSDARCPACGYSLRGCTSDRCPECGSELALGIVSAKPTNSTWWIASIYGCALSVFLSAVMLMQMMAKVGAVLEMPGLVQNVRYGMASTTELPRWPAVFAAVILSLLAGMLLAWVIRSRRDFSRWPAARRMIVGVLCWLSPMIMLAFIAWWTRG